MLPHPPLYQRNQRQPAVRQLGFLTETFSKMPQYMCASPATLLKRAAARQWIPQRLFEPGDKVQTFDKTKGEWISGVIAVNHDPPSFCEEKGCWEYPVIMDRATRQCRHLIWFEEKELMEYT
ncbi:hypothetical protein BD309DRAFT_1019530 [Dichomitus squalens]|uniref:Uncharacterized protein n=2 Tax=Dichomitus squalens TaxID=114155 RepID=A0A4Q9NT58_9APHY|nr:uncharacterized protein DICSQDRAFT_172611 [Dichomitus squalens LYAD-421 SS1]EJF58785.1 hypothetical protein DICSQDRAFT_172611 [Dichomitus squalens LYAD-421 SS1]TBU30841.1 hypothetical protein BD311DRAFT_658280 [Dichomitus squalens]TBU43121.1 hypothetical protein BD309DRAFT_1019530 [Dichomitus squalens]TBU53986.1 hypothetical protein BD310DRAFT_109715 [Dichomitus squalens]